MGSDPPELGKGLFGYRKSAVNQIIADRDIMLRQAEGRVRAAESKVAELETDLVGMRQRNTRMDEQLERLRQQLDALSKGVVAPVMEEARHQPPEQPFAEEQPAAEEHPFADEQPFAEEQPAAEEEPAASAWDEPPTVSAVEVPSSEYVVDEPADADEWLAADDEMWPGTEEPSPLAETEAAPEPSMSEDHLTYGVEMRLGEDTESETSDKAWMEPEPSFEVDRPEQEEPAVAAGRYGFEDYTSPDEDYTSGQEQPRYGDHASEQEQPGYGGFASQDETQVEEAPSPFSGFPFTSEPFDRAVEEATPAAETSSWEEESISHVGAPEPPAASEAPLEVHEPPAAVAADRGPTVSQETTDITNRFLTEELAGILAAAEESAARIVERARATTQRQIARSNRVWREVQAEVSRFASWREEVEPVIRAVQSKVEGVRTEIGDVPERIRQALAPMADSISSIDGDLADLAAACNPPLLLTPGGLESEESEHGSWTLDSEDDEAFGDHTESSGDDFDQSFTEASEHPYESPYREGEGDQGSGHLHAG